jgi:YidC/Oxa1 family membrane protein insertase
MNRQPPALDNKNFLAAILMSMAIIFGWQYFYVAPQLKQQEQIAQVQAQQQAQQQASGTAPAAVVATAVLPRDQILKASTRITIETPDVDGSINLKGAALDDLRLKNYRETVSKTSPEIVLLSPSGTKNAYFVEHYLVPAAGQSAKVPTPETVWTTPQDAVLGPDKPVILTWDNGAGLVFKREISIDDKFVFAVKQTVENKSSTPISLSQYARIQRQDTPHVEGWYVFFEGMLGVHDGKLTEVTYTDVAKPEGAINNESVGGWLGFTDKYWSTVLIPNKQSRVKVGYKHATENGREIYQTEYQSSQPITIAPGASTTFEDHVFAGAKVFGAIKAVGAKYQLDNFELMIDWGWFWFLTKPMLMLLEFVKGLVGNFGVAILIVTVLVKLAVFPLANKSYASMSKMKKLQPEMERLKAEYPDDKMKMQKELMELYKKEKVSPLSGCLPIVVQIPVFFSLYKVILTSIELRHAPFFGWVQDLSAPDPTHLFNLFGLIPWNPPAFLALGVWPILMGITMWVQMRLNPTPTDPVQASLFNWMPVIFTFTMGSFPVGLVIYWTWSNLLSIIQQAYIMKKNGVDVDILGNIRESIPFLKKKPAI